MDQLKNLLEGLKEKLEDGLGRAARQSPFYREPTKDTNNFRQSRKKRWCGEFQFCRRFLFCGGLFLI